MVACSSNNVSDKSPLTKAEQKKLPIDSQTVLMNSDSTKELSFTVLLNTKPSDEILAFMEQENIKINSKVGKILTCTAIPGAIRKMVIQDYVVKVEIAGKVYINEEPTK